MEYSFVHTMGWMLNKEDALSSQRDRERVSVEKAADRRLPERP